MKFDGLRKVVCLVEVEKKMNSKFKSLFKDISVYGLGNIFGTAIGFVTIPILTRLFTPEDYGVMSVLGAFTSMVSMFIIMGFTTAQSYFFFQTEEQSDRKITLSTSLIYRISVAILLCGIAFMFASPICKVLFNDQSYIPYLKIVLATIPISVLVVLFSNILRMNFEKWRYLGMNLGRRLVGVGLILLFIISFKMGLKGFFLSGLVSSAIFFLLGFLLVKDLIGTNFSMTRFKEMFFYALPLLPGSLSMWVLHFSDRYFLVNFTSKEAVGLYSIGYKLSTIIFLVTRAFRIAWAPFGFQVSKDKDVKEFYADVLFYYVTFLSITCVTLGLFAREVLMILTPSDYHAGSKVVGWLALGELFYGILPIMGMGILLTKNTRVNSYAFGTAAVLNIILNYFLITNFGYMGAAIATVISFFVADIIIYLYAQHYYPLPYKIKKILIIIGLSVVTIMLGNLLDMDYMLLTPLFKLLVFSVFIGLMFLFGALKIEYFRFGYTKVKQIVKSKLVTRK